MKKVTREVNYIIQNEFISDTKILEELIEIFNKKLAIIISNAENNLI